MLTLEVCLQMIWLFYNVVFTFRMSETTRKLKEEFQMYFDYGLTDSIPSYPWEGPSDDPVLHTKLTGFCYVSLLKMHNTHFSFW